MRYSLFYVDGHPLFKSLSETSWSPKISSINFRTKNWFAIFSVSPHPGKQPKTSFVLVLGVFWGSFPHLKATFLRLRHLEARIFLTNISTEKVWLPSSFSSEFPKAELSTCLMPSNSLASNSSVGWERGLWLGCYQSSSGFKEATLLLQLNWRALILRITQHMSLDVFHCFSMWFITSRCYHLDRAKGPQNDCPSITFAGFFSPTSRALNAASMPLALKIHIKKVWPQIVDLPTEKKWDPDIHDILAEIRLCETLAILSTCIKTVWNFRTLGIVKVSAQEKSLLLTIGVCFKLWLRNNLSHAW